MRISPSPMYAYVGHRSWDVMRISPLPTNAYVGHRWWSVMQIGPSPICTPMIFIGRGDRKISKRSLLPIFWKINGLFPTSETAPGGLVVERSPGVQEVVGSIPGRVIPKTCNMVLDASLLGTQHSKVRTRKYGWFTHCQLKNVTWQEAISMCLRYSILVWQHCICYK